MTVDDDDPSAIDEEFPGIKRDQWKRPLIHPVDGGQAVGYTRVSTLAKVLDDTTGLDIWKRRMASVGVARHEEIAALIAGLLFTGDKKADKPVNTALDELLDDALRRVNDAAAHGTAVHAFTDLDASGYVPQRMVPDVDSYHAALKQHGITCVESETFVVNDELETAGTFDGIYHHHDLGLVIGDKKTGERLSENALAAQLAVYAGSDRYNPTTYERTPLDIRTDVGLGIHIPRGKATTEFYLVDLTSGRLAANAAKWVMDWRKRRDLVTHLNPLTVEMYGAA